MTLGAGDIVDEARVAAAQMGGNVFALASKGCAVVGPQRLAVMALAINAQTPLTPPPIGLLL